MSPFLNAVAASELQRLHYQVAEKDFFFPFSKKIYGKLQKVTSLSMQVIYGTLKLTGFAADETMERSR